MTTETEDTDKPLNLFYPMISFEKQMFLDILENDGLLICAKGLNEYVIIMNLLRGYDDPGNLVFVVNAADYEEKYFMQKFNLVSLPTLSVERQKAYLNGGVHFVSTRILVVDLLKNRVPVEQVTGIIVMRAHSILESCQEAFVLRLYRQKNKTGFIKAFSHSAEAFTFGFSHVEKVMRNLFVKELFLWPRFHGSVIRDLKVSQPNVIELHVPLSNKTKLIQTCILDIMNYTTKELKRINRYLDLQEITSENCLTKKFHKILQAQLDTVWHQLSTKTKELIQDLKVMRSLILSLIHQDAVSFYCLVSKFRTPEYAKTNSGWILLDSAEQMFKYSRSRVFNPEREFEPELCSKWKYLNEILTVEIPEVRKKNKTTMAKSKILLLCNDSKTAKQLNLFLTIGPQAFMYWSAYRNSLDLPLLSKDYKSLEGKYSKDKDSSSIPSSMGAPKPKGNNNNASTSNECDSVVTKEEMEEDDLDQTNYLLTMTQSIIDKINNSSVKLESADESAFVPFTQMENMDLTQLEIENPLIFIQTFRNTDGGVCLEDTLREVRPDFIILYHSNVTAMRQIELYNTRKDDSYPSLMVFFLIHAQTTEEQAYLTSLRREKEAFELLIQTKSTMVIPSYQDGKSELTSNLVREDPAVAEANTRKGGGQESDTPQERPRVIVDMREFRSDLPALLYRKGIETDPIQNVASIVSGYMLLVDAHPQSMKYGYNKLEQYANFLYPCVDNQPSFQIGDYILTPDICVERKSLSDLIGSLNSGRLYTQCTQMCRNYARPMLLIEFDQNRPFKLLVGCHQIHRVSIISILERPLSGHHVVSNDISGAVVQEKLQLLTLHFPRLKLIWSPSPYATADLFFELKQGRPQPNAADASALGEDAGVESLLIERFNPRIHDFLIKLPGVNSKNISRLMNRGQSLDNLIKLSQDEIAEILENKSDAKMLWAILHNDFSSSDATNTEVKNVKKNRFGKPIRSKKF